MLAMLAMLAMGIAMADLVIHTWDLTRAIVADDALLVAPSRRSKWASATSYPLIAYGRSMRQDCGLVALDVPSDVGRHPVGATRARFGKRVGPIVVAAALVVMVGLWMIARPGPRLAQLSDSPTIALSDPFAVDWVSLLGNDDGPSSYARPWPMVAPAAPICVGFSRVKLTDRRQPTVAFCEVGPAQVLPDGVRIFRTSVAGPDTWVFLQFGQGVDEVDARVRTSTSEVELGTDRTYVADTFVALLVPNEHVTATIEWRSEIGTSYRLAFPHGFGEPENMTSE